MKLLGIVGTSDTVTARDVAYNMLAFTADKVEQLAALKEEGEEL